LTKKRISSFIVAILAVALSACVTQEFQNDETPVVKNQANRDDMAATRISLGLGYLKMGNMAQAKQNLEKAKTFSPEMVQVYTAFAHYYETVGEKELTIVSFEEALSLKSDDADTLNNYGVYLCRQDQTEAAEKQFLKAIAVPSYLLVAKSYENLSSCFLQKDNFVKAEMYLHKAVMHSPGNASILFQMVRLQYAMGKYTQAKIFEQRFEKVTRRFTPQSLALAYKVYWKLGQDRTATNYGTMLVKMYPQSWEAKQYLLNELELIEADSLAKRYKLTQISDTPMKSKKRVVKLSPKKALSNNVTTSNAVNSASLVELEIATQQDIQAPPKSVLNKINSKSAPSTSIASSAAINAALTMESVEPVSSVPEQKQRTVSKLSANPSDQDKRVVALMAPITAENNRTKILAVESKTNKVADKNLVTNAKAEVIGGTEKEVALEDREIFQTAKKTVLIIEDVPKVEEPLIIASTKSQQSGAASNKLADIHVVTKGDTLYGISMKYNIKISALRRWNNLTVKNKIRINKKLYLIDPKTVNE
jgi:type IV pilus assembly protein PilF